MRTIFKNELFLLNLLMVLLVLLVFLQPSSVLRAAIAIPFMLFFPGYCLVALLWPANDHPGIAERMWLSIVLSIAVFPFAGLLLTVTPWGITLNSSLFSMAVAIITFSAGAQYRRQRLTADRRFSFDWRFLPFHWHGASHREKAVNYFVSIAILFCLGSLAYAILLPNIGERFTEFYLLGESGQDDGYPRIVEEGSELMPIIGIINREGKSLDYRVQIKIGDREVGKELKATLDNYEKWEQTVYFPVLTAGQQRADFILYRGDASQPYRQVYLWLDVKAPGQPYTVLRASTEPERFAKGRTIEVKVEIENREGNEVSYELYTWESWSEATRRIKEVGIITLADKQRWQGVIVTLMAFDPEKTKERLDIMLYQAGEDEPQQTVSLPLFAEESR